MPTFNNKVKVDSLAARNPSYTKNLLHQQDFCEMKELSLISHIEALKTAANPPVVSHDVNGSSNTCNFPQIISISTYNNNNKETCSNPLVPGRPKSSSWAWDPSLVPGNLRKEADNKTINCTVEEILSRGSSFLSKRYDESQELSVLEKSVIMKQKRKSVKSSKRRSSKKNDARCASGKSKGKEDTASVTPSKSVPIITPSSQFPFSLNANDIDPLTALCKGIKIQEKTSINVKKAPYSRKAPLPQNPIPPQKSSSPARTSLNNALAEYNKQSALKATAVSPEKNKKKTSVDEGHKTVKVFLSEKQSGIIQDCGVGIPCAPPATPTAEQMRRVEYVPSLQDIRAQRSFRQRLEMMEAKAASKEKKKLEESMKAEKMSLREKKMEIKKKQRLEIYALNKLMTELEHERFHQFMANAGSNI